MASENYRVDWCLLRESFSVDFSTHMERWRGAYEEENPHPHPGVSTGFLEESPLITILFTAKCDSSTMAVAVFNLENIKLRN